MDDPDPSTARVEDFTIRASNDGDLSLVCAHYARGCWWETDFGVLWQPALPGDSLGDLLDAARAHLAEAHAIVVDGSVVPAP